MCTNDNKNLKKKEVLCMETTEKVLEVLKNSQEPLKSAQIVEQTGIEKKEVDKAIKKLKAEGKIESPKNCFYQSV